jgi:alkaline phosphatase
MHIMKHLFTVAIIIFSFTSEAQPSFKTSQIFAHNDYERAQPFHTAYNLKVGYIEADIFFVDNEILVAHHKHEIKPERKLETLYLKPLQKQVQANKGFVYSDRKATLTLMVDLKTEGTETLKALVKQLENYRDLLSCPTLQVMISGNVPDPGDWDSYPPYIHFDGRPGIAYTPEQLKRISMISTNFTSHVKWDGKSKIPDADRKKIANLVDEVHAKGKKFRFWATPDFDHAWNELIELQMDVIVTDKVEALAAFLNGKR